MCFTKEEERQILINHINHLDGKIREVLDVMIAAYPTPVSEAYIREQLAMKGEYAFYSVLRNIRIFVDIEKISQQGEPVKYQLSGDYIKTAKANLIFKKMGM